MKEEDIHRLASITSLEKTSFINNINEKGAIVNLDTPGPGIYYSIKSAYNVKDQICNNSSKIIEHYKPSYHSTVYSRLYAAGHFAKYIVANDSHCMGIGKNSLCRYYNKIILGGSSSGSVKSLLTDPSLSYSICSDTAGSVILPCTQTNLWAFKPSKGRVSRYGLHEYCPVLDRVSIAARSIDTLKTVFDIIKGPDEFDPFTTELIHNKEAISNIYTIESIEHLPYSSVKINWQTVADHWKPIISVYGFSSNHRFDGVRFNKSIVSAALDNSKKTEHRNKLLTQLVKKRIVKGVKYIIDKPVFKPLNIEDIITGCSYHSIFILKHTIATSYDEINKLEFRYGLGNVINYCSILKPYKNYSLEFLAPAGYEEYLFKFVNEFTY